MAAESKPGSKLDRLAARSARYLSIEKLVLMRHVGYASAGFSAAALFAALLSTGRDSLLENAILLFAIAIPFWVVYAMVVESIIFLGKPSYSFLKSPEFETTGGILILVPGCCTIGGLTLMLWRFSMPIAISFLVSLSIATGLLFLISWQIERHIENREANKHVQPKEPDSSEA